MVARGGTIAVHDTVFQENRGKSQMCLPGTLFRQHQTLAAFCPSALLILRVNVQCSQLFRKRRMDVVQDHQLIRVYVTLSDEPFNHTNHINVSRQFILDCATYVTTPASFGAGLLVQWANLTITDSEFLGNNAYFFGGGLVQLDAGFMNIRNTRFEYNNADQGGGAMAIATASDADRWAGGVICVLHTVHSLLTTLYCRQVPWF